MPAQDPQNDEQIFFTLTDFARIQQAAGRSAPETEKGDPEAYLRRILRPHDEAGFRAADEAVMLVWRKKLDAALGSLTKSEIRRQLCLPYQPPPHAALERLAQLFQSESFLRYVNAYHYFAIRFIPAWTEFREFAAAPAAVVCPEENTPYFALAVPPSLEFDGADRLFEDFEKHLLSDSDNAEIRIALEFLDGFENEETRRILVDLKEPSAFELWLRGLRPETDGTLLTRFRQIADGLTNWAIDRRNFYRNLDPKPEFGVRSDLIPGAPEVADQPVGGWAVSHSAAARFALADVYWIAKLFRADISPTGAVTYQRYNWLHLLRFRAIFDRKDGTVAGVRNDVEQLSWAEETLRSVFDLVCDLVQNSVEVTLENAAHPDADDAANSDEPLTSWRGVFDEELTEIERQRGLRHYRDPSLPPEMLTGGGATPVAPEGGGQSSLGAEGSAAQSGTTPAQTAASAGKQNVFPRWSRRLCGSPQPAGLIGLAFSGGGIRSATLNLGVLQGLQELDLLRHFDYISTVSGGSFICSWLIGNVKRSAHWLGRFTDWSESIQHLRDFSNYLAPRKGFFSPDTLSIGITWLRNTIFIQLSALTDLFFVLLVSTLCMRGFVDAGCMPWLDFTILALAGICVAGSVFVFLYRLSSVSNSCPARLVWLLAVVPALVGSTALASLFRAAAPPFSEVWPCLSSTYPFTDLLKQAYKPWIWILVCGAVGLAALAWVTLQRQKVLLTSVIVMVCTCVLYLELVTLYFGFRELKALGEAAYSVAFVFGPPLVLLAFWIPILLLIGLCGGAANEAQREWWTRYGSTLFLLTGSWIVICGVSLFGPWIFVHLVRAMRTRGSVIPWTAIIGWMGTVVGGILAGKNRKTNGASSTGSNRLLQVLAKAGAVLFIAGSLLLGSTLMYVLLFLILGPNDSVLASEPLKEFCAFAWQPLLMALGVLLTLGWLFSRRFEINIFGFSQFYRNRLVRCYLGATRWTPGMRRPDPFTNFDFRDDTKLWSFRTDAPSEDGEQHGKQCNVYRGPYPLLNCCLNLTGSSDLALNTRHGASFTLTPLRCGSDRARVGYAPTWKKRDGRTKPFKYADGVQLGQAVAVSGAAVSSNMGYNSSPLVSFLLTMFNVRLGWWFPNPGKGRWRKRGITSSLRYLLAELFGLANETLDYVNVSDGGHFENLAIYELVRRRCKLIVACDAECDPDLQFGSLGKLIRLCAVDFGAEIDLRVDSIRPQANGLSLSHCAVGTIKYSTGETGRLIYLKASITGDEDVSIAQYRSEHPSFPHQSTSDQFYSEDQFESYRRLGLEMVRSSFRGNVAGDPPFAIAERMFDVLTPAALSSSRFIELGNVLNRLWESFRQDSDLMAFMNELLASNIDELGAAAAAVSVKDKELCIGLEMIQLMENVFLDLRLDDYWEHPDYRGWAILFMRWARSPRFREIWRRTHRTFGIRFEYFCNANLGLIRDTPIVRV